MRIQVNITKRHQRRKLNDGSVKEYDRYVVNYRNPKTGKRVQQFYERQKEAQAAQRQILVDLDQGIFSNEKQNLTVAEAYDYWIKNRSMEIKRMTLRGYGCYLNYIVGPLLSGTPKQRMAHKLTGKIPPDCQLVPMLGDIKISELTTADIRAWHRQLSEMVGSYSARRSMQRLKTILGLAAEDYNLRPPVMPARLGRGKRKEKKAILSPGQIALLLREAKKDQRWGIYYAFPFMAGTRPSEQLALHWEDVDFERGFITIRRMIERDGAVTNFTKTEAGMREIPLWSDLREALLGWKKRCPRKDGELKLVFPGYGKKNQWPCPQLGGNPMLYVNFRKRVWAPAFKRLAALSIPYVTPHSARHSFISTLQERGVEVGLVAKIAGHSNPAVTLSYYTHAVRGGQDALETLSEAFT
ncbi:MAG: site-specific integrase [Alphaproteobacteria bacterium]|nr:site-specific integrase [Alphaproteobacteria bacterium]